MHTDDPYTVVMPEPCTVRTPRGLQRGLVVGRLGARELVLHGVGGFDTVSWAPSEQATVVGPAEWAPWSASIAANA